MGLSPLDRSGDGVELVEHVVLAQTHRLALHFKEPAVPGGEAMQLLVTRELVFAPGPVEPRDALTRCVQLPDQRFEDTADPNQRSRSLFVQLAEDPLVPRCDFAQAHGSQHYNAWSPAEAGHYDLRGARSTFLTCTRAQATRELLYYARSQCRQPFR